MTSCTLIADPTSRNTTAIALALAVSGIKFSREEGVPASAPVLKLDSRMYSAGGTSSLLRYAGHVGKLYPDNATKALAVDEALAVVTLSKPDYGVLDELFAIAPGPFLLGSEMSVADIAVLCLPHDRLSKFSNLLATADSARADPRVAPNLSN